MTPACDVAAEAIEMPVDRLAPSEDWAVGVAVSWAAGELSDAVSEEAAAGEVARRMLVLSEPATAELAAEAVPIWMLVLRAGVSVA